jgi:serine/threonine protein phosphatase 1
MKILSKLLRSRTAEPRVPPGTVVYVIGDVHGHSDLLDEVFRRIEADAGLMRNKRVIEVYLGDYVDRGPDTKGVINRLIYRSEHREIIPLRGNHEEMLLNSLDGPDMFEAWMRVGGLDTVASYGVAVRQPLDRTAVQDALDDWLRAVPRNHVEFLSRLHYTTTIGDYLFVHAGIRPGVELENQNARDLLWIRGEFLESRLDHGRVVVHGHTPVQTPEFRPNRINIDTGAYLTNRLTCLRLMGEHRDVIS